MPHSQLGPTLIYVPTHVNCYTVVVTALDLHVLQNSKNGLKMLNNPFFLVEINPNTIIDIHHETMTACF